MVNKIKNIFNKNFVRNVFVMATGTAAAQLITMVLSPIITRLYGPEAFGIMGTFNSMISIIIPIAALAYPIAIVLPKSEQDAKGLARLSLIITGIISILTFVIILLFNQQIINSFNLNEIANYLFLIPLVVIFSGLLQVTEQWLIRTKQFSISARVTLYHSLITNGGKVGIGLFYPMASVLVVISALGNGIKSFMMVMFIRKSKVQASVSSRENKKSIKTLAKEYRDFPIYRAPEKLLNAVSQGLPVLMLTAFFGPTSAGFYTIGKTVLSLPSQLIGKAVGDVFYPRVSEAYNNHENVTVLIRKATIALAIVGALPFLLVILFGPWLFSFVFGSDWTVAGEYARWIALWSFFGFINRPSVQALPVLNAQRFQLIYTIIMLVVRLGALAIGYLVFASDILAIALFGIAGALLNVGLITITLQISRKRNNEKVR